MIINDMKFYEYYLAPVTGLVVLNYFPSKAILK
jgi:hypothetical protein